MHIARAPQVPGAGVGVPTSSSLPNATRPGASTASALATATQSLPPTAASPAPHGHIMPTTFPSSFPDHPEWRNPKPPHPTPYAIFRNPLADNMMIFFLVLVGCGIFMFLLLSLTRWCDRHKNTEDPMITEATTWSEEYKDEPDRDRGRNQKALPQPGQQQHLAPRALQPHSGKPGSYGNPRRYSSGTATSYGTTTTQATTANGYLAAGTGAGASMYANTSGSTMGYYSDAAQAGSTTTVNSTSTAGPPSYGLHHHQPPSPPRQQQLQQLDDAAPEQRPRYNQYHTAHPPPHAASRTNHLTPPPRSNSGAHQHQHQMRLAAPAPAPVAPAGGAPGTGRTVSSRRKPAPSAAPYADPLHPPPVQQPQWTRF